MSRKQSETTQLRHLKREVAILNRQYMALSVEAACNLSRALAAELALKAWQARFDALLKLGLTENKP